MYPASFSGRTAEDVSCVVLATPLDPRIPPMVHVRVFVYEFSLSHEFLLYVAYCPNTSPYRMSMVVVEAVTVGLVVLVKYR